MFEGMDFFKYVKFVLIDEQLEVKKQKKKVKNKLIIQGDCFLEIKMENMDVSQE